jgi:hypothetical protein
MKKLTLALAAIALAAVSADAQQALTQTTLSAAVTTTSGRTIQVASATGIAAPSPQSGTSTQLYIDDEVLDVTAVNGTLVTVRRGADGTKASTHASGANVYVTPAGLGAFIDYSLGGSCLSGSYPATPMVDYLDAQTYQCVNGQWIIQTVQGQQHFPSTLIATSSYSNNSTTFSNTALSFPVSANHTYTATCLVVWSASATTAGPKFQITGPSSPATVLFSVDGGTGAAAYADASATAFSSAITAFGTAGATSTNYTAHINISVVNGANSGTVTLQAAANGTGTLTIQPGSYCVQQ